VSAYVRPFVLLVVPNVLVVSALVFSAGALRRGFMAILLLGVLLVARWGTGVALARDGSVWGTLLDPFDNAALEWVTRDWTFAERGARAIPASGWLAADRALWLGLAAVAMGWLVHAFRFEVVLPFDTSHRREPIVEVPIVAAEGSVALSGAGARVGGWPALRAEARMDLSRDARRARFRDARTPGRCWRPLSSPASGAALPG
jgi:hypothetical protein